MTKKELKKWLKRCGSNARLCDGCPFKEHSSCFAEIKLAALALIKKQEKEINQLKTECTLLDDELRNARQETINFITEQEKKIERLKDENKENCWKCIEAKRVTEEDYAKLQEEFANYQIASDKEMIAQVKQAKIEAVKEFAEKAKAKSYVNNYCREVVEIDKIDELLKEYE